MSKDTGSCCPCTCSLCRSCFSKLCQSCCPYLSSKDRYAAVEYQPIEPPTPTHQSLFAARKSLKSLPTQYFPHQSDQAENEYDYDNQVITEEPKSLKQSQLDYSVGKHSRTKSGRDTRGSPDDSSPYDSGDEMNVSVGFVDYERTTVNEDRDIRICRTPEMEIEQDDDTCDDSESDSEEYRLAIRSQSEGLQMSSDILPIRHRSEQVQQAASPHKPCMVFSLYFDEKHGILIVHLLRAFNLPTKRAESASNPFAEVYLLPIKSEVQESRILHRTLSPIFDQAFKFTNVRLEEVRKQLLVVRIYLHTKHHFIGGAFFSLEKANLFGGSNTVDLTVFDEEEGLKDKSKGDILLSITYHPEAGTLEVLTWEASHLKKQDLIGLPNPYMKVNLMFKGSRISKWTTNALKNTLNPIFNELCVLDIGSINLEELQVEVIVMDYDRFGRNSELGSIMFGSNVPNENGKKHWEQVISNPNVSHMCWHVITISETSTSRGLRSPARSRKSPASCVAPTEK